MLAGALRSIATVYVGSDAAARANVIVTDIPLAGCAFYLACHDLPQRWRRRVDAATRYEPPKLVGELLATRALEDKNIKYLVNDLPVATTEMEQAEHLTSHAPGLIAHDFDESVLRRRQDPGGG